MGERVGWGEGEEKEGEGEKGEGKFVLLVLVSTPGDLLDNCPLRLDLQHSRAGEMACI